MSSVVFNASAGAVGKAQLQNANDLFPTSIGGANKMYRYQHIMPAPADHKSGNNNSSSSSSGNPSGQMTIKTRKYTPRGMALAASVAAAAAAAAAASNSGSMCGSSVTGGGSSPYNVDQSQSVQRRNARERNRVKQVNNSFARLRQHIPQTIIADLTKGGGRGPHKKISKVDTLRIAVEYIRRLQDLVDDLNGGPSSNSSSSAAAQLQLCLDETSSNSSRSSSSSNSTISSSNSPLAAHNLYYSSALLAATPLQQQQQLQRQQYPNNPLTPISMNGNTAVPAATAAVAGATAAGGNLMSTCHSPTSSFNSSMSFDSGTYEAAPQQLSPPVPTSSSASSSSSSLDAQLQLKFEPYEHFQLDEEDCTPDDEEILDYISLWQEQ